MIHWRVTLIIRLLGLDDNDPELFRTLEDVGDIRGINLDSNHRAWLGIPYAKPPVDDLRFAPPEKVEPWKDSESYKDTREQPKACTQTPDFAFGEDFEGTQVWNPNTEISEDCLYLNVHAPRNSSGRPLPVLVWIFGGGFTSGSATLDVYNPKQYVDKELIFVAMQYRVGAHGFLYFGEDSGAPGNVGMLDQVMALEWVRDNVKAFGGDPDDVTIMGESAGAASAALHMVSPRSCGLFNKVILQSSGINPRWGFVDPETAKTRAEKLADEVGCIVYPRFLEDTVNCMREKSSQSIQDAIYNVEPYTIDFYPFVPTVDGDFLPASPAKMLEKKAFSKDKDVLIGTNANEGFWSLMYYLTDVYPNRELSEREKMLSKQEFKDSVNSIFTFYPPQVLYSIWLLDVGGQESGNQER